MPSSADKLAVIPSGGELSSAVILGNGITRIGLMMPDGWTTAALTFQVATGMVGPWGNLYDTDGQEVTIAETVALAGRGISITGGMLAALLPWRFFKIRSGSSATPVTQTAERAIELYAEV